MQLSMQQFSLALISYLACCVLLFGQVHWVVMLFGVASAAYIWTVLRGRLKLFSGRWLKLLLAASLPLSLWASSSGGHYQMLLSVVMLGYSLKFCELRQRRDIEFFALTGMFLVAGALVFSVKPGFALLGMLVAVLHLLLLLSLDVSLNSQQLKKTLLWSVAALPLTVALFIIVPRLGPLWKMPNVQQATTGLSEQIRPGDISQLIRSGDLVFRAEFDRLPPTQQELYWRAMILDQFDGEQWQRSELAKQSVDKQPSAGSLRSAYQLLMEPASQPWLPSLDSSYHRGSDAEPNLDLSWQRSGERFPRKIIALDWMEQQAVGTLSPELLNYWRRLPENLPERLVDLAEQLQVEQVQQQDRKPDQNMAQLQQWMRSQAYQYTLNPPPYPGLLGLEQFMFDRQLGFCVHYAQAVVVMARLMDIPARMVAGYLGGEWDEAGQVLTVRQYDAHAWAEYWNGHAWVRVDATAWIAPDRVNQGMQQASSTAEQWRELAGFSGIWLSPQFTQLRLWLAQADYWWARWVLNFDQQRQLSLFAKLQAWLPKLSLVMISLGILGLAVMMLLVLLLKPWRWRPVSAETRALRRELRRCRRKGLSRQAGESLTEFAARVAKHDTEAYLQLAQAVNRYQQARFSTP